MQNWLNQKQKENVDKSVKFFDSLDKKQRAYFYDMFSDNKLKSHMCALENGCAYICSPDEYSPFENGDYIVYSFFDNEVWVQIAWSKFYKEIYVSGYVPTKNGWYEWQEYFNGPVTCTNGGIPRDEKKRISFEDALQEAKKRVSVNKNKLSENNSLNDGYTSNQDRTLQEDKVKVGLQVFSENEDSSSDYRKISIPSVHSLQTLKNRLLAIKSLWNFDSNSINKIYIEGAGEAIVKNIPSENVERSSYMKDFVYFVMYDGTNFIYLGDTQQKGRV